MQHLRHRDRHHCGTQWGEVLRELANTFRVGATALADVHRSAELEDVSAVESSGLDDPHDAISGVAHASLGSNHLGPTLLRAGAGDHGHVAVHHQRVLDEHAVGKLRGRLNLGDLPAGVLECFHVALPLLQRQVRIDRLALDMGQESISNVRTGTTNAFLDITAASLARPALQPRQKRTRVGRLGTGVAPAFTLTDMTEGVGRDEGALAPFIKRIALCRPSSLRMSLAQCCSSRERTPPTSLAASSPSTAAPARQPGSRTSETDIP